MIYVNFRSTGIWCTLLKVYSYHIPNNSYKKSQNNCHYEKYKKLRTLSKESISSDYKKFVECSQHNVRQNSRYFWKYVSLKRGSEDRVPDRVFFNDRIAYNGVDICNLFADFFGSVYLPTDGVGVDIAGDLVVEREVFSGINLDVPSVVKRLSSVKNNISPGPDGLPASFLKSCAGVLAIPLIKIFSLSLDTGVFPTKWKYSYVMPLLKSGDKRNVENYRPISKLSDISKVFESIVLEHLSDALRHNIVADQHGFCPGRSTETNLLVYTDYIYNAIERGAQVDAVYTDFSKAFDRVNRLKLLQRLRGYGVKGSMFSWLNSYLKNRFQVIKLGKFLSRDIPVTSGVPQGSHLAPLLFCLFINDLALQFKHARFLFFADDLKVFLEIDDVGSCERLQCDLGALSDWCKESGMSLNESKCRSITFSRRKRPIVFDYKIANNTLEKVDSIKDLGIILDSKLHFDLHVQDVANRCSRLSGFVRRQTVDFPDWTCVALLFNTLIRPILEYCSLIWSPFYRVHIDRLERVQRRFLNYILFKCRIDKNNYSYSERLRLLGFQSLEMRRENRNVVFIFKLLHRQIDCPEIMAHIHFREGAYPIRDMDTLERTFHRTSYGLNCPINSLIRAANNAYRQVDLLNISLQGLKTFLAGRSEQ